jgi:dihydrofolate reductase
MKAIIACDPTGGIGYQNKLPWDNISGDLARFKKLTSGGIVVMGRNTWESLPVQPLSNRLNIIITQSIITVPHSVVVLSTTKYLKYMRDAWLIGGAKLIETCWDMIDEIHLTRTFTEYPCDTHINLLKLQNEYERESIETHSDHTYEIWKRKCNNTKIY